MSCIPDIGLRAARAALLAAALTGLAGLAACGFQPLYGETAPGSAEMLSRVEIGYMPDRTGQKLRNLLVDRLAPRGPVGDPLYVLDVTITESIADLAVRVDESATRANLTMLAAYTLTRAGAEAETLPVLRSSVRSVSSYNRLQSRYATLAAEEDARNRALRQIADEIRLRIAAALGNPETMRPRPRAAAPESRR